MACPGFTSDWRFYSSRLWLHKTEFAFQSFGAPGRDLAHSRRRKIESALETSSPTLNLRLSAAQRAATESGRVGRTESRFGCEVGGCVFTGGGADFETAAGGSVAVVSGLMGAALSTRAGNAVLGFGAATESAALAVEAIDSLVAACGGADG